MTKLSNCKWKLLIFADFIILIVINTIFFDLYLWFDLIYLVFLESHWCPNDGNLEYFNTIKIIVFIVIISLNITHKKILILLLCTSLFSFLFLLNYYVTWISIEFGSEKYLVRWFFIVKNLQIGRVLAWKLW